MTASLNATAMPRAGALTLFGPETARELITTLPTPLLFSWGSGLLCDLAEQGEPATRLRRLAYKFNKLQTGGSSRKDSLLQYKTDIANTLLPFWKKVKGNPLQKNGSNALFENWSHWWQSERFNLFDSISEANLYVSEAEFRQDLLDRNLSTHWGFFSPFLDQINPNDLNSATSFSHFILQIPAEERDTLLAQYLSTKLPWHIGVYRRFRETSQKQMENGQSGLDALQELKRCVPTFYETDLIAMDTQSPFDLALGHYYYEKHNHPYRRFLGYYTLYRELKNQEVRSYLIDPESIPLWTPAWEIRLRETSLKETDFDSLIRSFDDFQHGRISKNHSYEVDEKLRKEYEKTHRLFLSQRRDRIDRDRPVFPTIGAFACCSRLPIEDPQFSPYHKEFGKRLKLWTKRIARLAFIPGKGLVGSRRFVTPHRILRYLQTERKRLGISEELILEIAREFAEFDGMVFLSFFYDSLRKAQTAGQIGACLIFYRAISESLHDPDKTFLYYERVLETLLQTSNPLEEAEKFWNFMTRLNGKTSRKPILKPTYSGYSIGEKLAIWSEFLDADIKLTYDDADLALKYLFTKPPKDRKKLSDYIDWFYEKQEEDSDCIPKLQAGLKRKVLKNFPEIRERLQALPDHHAGAETAFVKNIYPGISAADLEAATELCEEGLNLHGEWFRQYRSLPPEKRRKLLSSAQARSIELLEGPVLQNAPDLGEMMALLIAVGNPKLEAQTVFNILTYAKVRKPKSAPTFPMDLGENISCGILSAKTVQPDKEKIKRHLRPLLRFKTLKNVLDYLPAVFPDGMTIDENNFLAIINETLKTMHRLPRWKRKISRNDIYNLLLIRALYGYATPETRESLFQFETAGTPQALQSSIMAASRFFEDFLAEANRTFPIPFAPEELAWNFERGNGKSVPRESAVFFGVSRIKKYGQKTEVVKFVREILAWDHFGEYKNTTRYLLQEAGLNLTDTVTEKNVVIFAQILLQVFSNHQGGLKTNFDFFVMELLMAYALHSPKAAEAQKIAKDFQFSARKSDLNESFQQLGLFYSKLHEIAKGMEVSFVPKFLKETMQQLLQEREKMGKITYQSGKLRFVPLHGKMGAFFGYMGEDCLAKEDYALNSLSDPDFLPVGMAFQGRLAGVFQLYTRTIRGQKCMIVSGIDPKENIVFDPEIFVPALEKALLIVARANGYQQILLTDISGTLSSRRGKLEETLKRRYPTTLSVSAPNQREFCFPIQCLHRHKGLRGYAEHRNFRHIWSSESP